MSAPDDSERELSGDDALAAEYVLGVLAAGERRAAAARIDGDARFARLVDGWEAHLAPMAEAYEPTPVPDGIKAAIDRRLFDQTRRAPPAGAGLWQSLALWRGLAFAALAAIVLLVAWPYAVPPPTPAERLVASLAPQDSDVHYFVVYDARSRDIGLSHVTGARAQGRDFELWVIEGDQSPVSLGIIPVGSSVHLAVTDEMRARIGAGAVFAISLEPPGGSPTGQPTGPVVAAGNLHDV